jgi:hypothetical protein
MCEFRVSGLDRIPVDFADLRSGESARQSNGSGFPTSSIGGISNGQRLSWAPIRGLAQNAARGRKGITSVGSPSDNTSHFRRLGGTSEHV